MSERYRKCRRSTVIVPRSALPHDVLQNRNGPYRIMSVRAFEKSFLAKKYFSLRFACSFVIFPVMLILFYFLLSSREPLPLTYLARSPHMIVRPSCKERVRCSGVYILRIRKVLSFGTHMRIIGLNYLRKK